MQDTIIVNQEKYDQLIQSFISGGKENLHVLADFDGTLTQQFTNGKNRGALIQVLYKDGYLSPEYQKLAKGLENKYLPIEQDFTISDEEKKQAMESRWIEHKIILVEEGLTKQNIYDAMESQKVNLRVNSKEFFEILTFNDIPLVILSSGGLGTISIQRYLENQNSMYENISLIGNEFVRENDIAVDFKKPIIHCMNKDETVIKDLPEIYNKVKNRKNIILLGNSIGDTKMANGFEYNNLLKIGFLNDKIEQNIEKYKANYDVLILNDGNMSFINTLLEEIL